MLNRSKQAARYGHIWTWSDHNKIIAGIEEMKLQYKQHDINNAHLKEVILAYESLIGKIQESKSITSVRTLLKDFYLPGDKKEVRKNLKIYLSGSADEVDYRKSVKIAYGKYLNLFDPIEMNKQSDPDLVNKDKQAIDDCDILVAYIRKFTCGTIMEIQYTYNLDKDIPIYVITSDRFIKDIWLSHHTNRFFSSIRSCFDFILDDFKVLPIEDNKEK